MISPKSVCNVTDMVENSGIFWKRKQGKISKKITPQSGENDRQRMADKKNDHKDKKIAEKKC